MNTPAPATPARAILVTPAGRGSRSGNRVTALRWAAHLRRSGLRTRLVQRWQSEPCELLIAIHAVKSAGSVLAAAAALPNVRIVVVLAGTDVYPRFDPPADVSAALGRSDAIVALQPAAAAALPARLRAKVRTIVQSATALPATRPPRFRACMLAHLRAVKAPLLPIEALRLLPPTPPCELLLAGRALDPDTGAALATALQHEPRARWLGELPRRAARQLLADSHVCIVPSTSEGGANVVSEAIAAGTPVLASAVPGNLGLLGSDWPGLFPVGSAVALAALWQRLQTDATFAAELTARTLALQPMVAPAREQAELARLLQALAIGAAVD